MTLKRFAQFFQGPLLGLVAICSSLQAATVQYRVTVDTSAFNATPGFIELQFNQANSATSLSGSAVITGFAAPSLVGNPAGTGGSTGVTGSFTSPPLTIPNNVGAANYFDQGVSKFGTGFSFLLTFNGAVAGGNSVDPSGFYVFLLDSGYNSLVTTSNSSNEVANLILNPNGSISTSGSRYATVAAVVATPEPVTWITGLVVALMIPALRRALKQNRAA